jgi:hypothetical protein
LAKLYDKDGQPNRREVPPDSGALAVVGFSWEQVIELLSNQIGEAAPEVRKRTTMWLIRARQNGFRIEFFDDEDALSRRLQQNSNDGPQVHAGRLTWF